MGPMVQFIAQMVEYNETLTLCRTFIENIDKKKKLLIQGTSRTILRVLVAVWTDISMKNYGLRRFYKKMTPKPRKSFLTTLLWMNFFAESDSGIGKIENPLKKIRRPVRRVGFLWPWYCTWSCISLALVLYLVLHFVFLSLVT